MIAAPEQNIGSCPGCSKMELLHKEHGKEGEYEVLYTAYYPGYKEHIDSTVKP